jgi:hypothetical protein
MAAAWTRLRHGEHLLFMSIQQTALSMKTPVSPLSSRAQPRDLQFSPQNCRPDRVLMGLQPT